MPIISPAVPYPSYDVLFCLDADLFVLRFIAEITKRINPKIDPSTRVR